MNFKKFEEYLNLGIVKKRSPNKERARFLLKEAKKKKQFLETVLKDIPLEKIYANFIVDSCYDIIMELIRVKLYLAGFKCSGEGAHEAEISYARIIGFHELDIRFINEIRYYRNGIKYYGIILHKEYADKVLKFLYKIYPKLK